LPAELEFIELQPRSGAHIVFKPFANGSAVGIVPLARLPLATDGALSTRDHSMRLLLISICLVPALSLAQDDWRSLPPNAQPALNTPPGGTPPKSGSTPATTPPR